MKAAFFHALTLGIALATTGCASTYLAARDGGIVTNSPVMAHAHDFFAGDSGAKLYEQWWRPVGPSRGTVVVVHGLKDHGSRYDEMAERLVEHGFAVYALDLRGHAHSEGERAYVDSFSQYVNDLDVFIKHVEAREGGAPPFLFGHSMGGAIVTSYLLDHKAAVRGAILHAAALRLDVSGFTRFNLGVGSALAPHAGLFQLNLDDFSRDPEVVRAAKSDPMIYQPAAPVRTAKELIDATLRNGERLEEIQIPLLILQGEEDKVTPRAGSEELYRRARSSDKTLKLYPHLVHDLVHEPEKKAVLADILGWLEARAPG